MSFVFRTTSLNAANIVNRIGSFKQRDNRWFKKIAKIITVFHELQQSKDEHDWYQFGVKPSLGNHVKNRYTLNPNHYTKKLREKEKLKNFTSFGRRRWVACLPYNFKRVWHTPSPYNITFDDAHLKINGNRLIRYIDVYSPNNNKTVILLNKCREREFTKKKIQLILQENNIKFQKHWTKNRLIQTLMSF